MSRAGDRTEPFPLRRRGTVDAMRVAGRRSDVHGLVEFDVTEARRLIDEYETETGERLSFTAFLVHCLARAVDEHPETQAYRDWRGRLVVFESVDVMVVVETTVDGERLALPHVLRGTERRSVRSVHEEIRAASGRPARYSAPPGSRSSCGSPELSGGCSTGCRGGHRAAGSASPGR